HAGKMAVGVAARTLAVEAVSTHRAEASVQAAGAVARGDTEAGVEKFATVFVGGKIGKGAGAVAERKLLGGVESNSVAAAAGEFGADPRASRRDPLIRRAESQGLAAAQGTGSPGAITSASGLFSVTITNGLYRNLGGTRQ